MSQYTEKEIRDIINVLVADGYLNLTSGQYPILKITAKSVNVLKNGEKVYQKVHKKKDNLIEDNTLFDLLRKLRKEISSKENLPPYVIFPDSTLLDMARLYPVDAEALLNIKGVGQNKLQKYGDLFLAEIRKYVDENKINISV